MLPPECKPRQLALDEDKAIWTAANSDSGEVYVALFNLRDEALEVALDLRIADIAVHAPWKELWTGEERSAGETIITEKLPTHGCAVFRSRI